jgi:hypothetical protein
VTKIDRKSDATQQYARTILTKSSAIIAPTISAIIRYAFAVPTRSPKFTRDRRVAGLTCMTASRSQNAERASMLQLKDSKISVPSHPGENPAAANRMAGTSNPSALTSLVRWLSSVLL